MTIIFTIHICYSFYFPLRFNRSYYSFYTLMTMMTSPHIAKVKPIRFCHWLPADVSAPVTGWQTMATVAEVSLGMMQKSEMKSHRRL